MTELTLTRGDTLSVAWTVNTRTGLIGTATASEVFQWVISPNAYHD